MGFDQLPEFPQGGVARADSGNMGIPPESFQTALRDRGFDLIEAGKRPEDNPAVAAALQAEVDTLATQMGFPAQPQPAAAAPAPVPETRPAPRPGVPAVPAAPAAAAGPVLPGGGAQPRLSDQDLRSKIQNVLKKYGDDPEAIARAYVHTDAARTQSQQQRAIEISALREEVGGLRSEIRDLISTRHAGPTGAFPQTGQGVESATPQVPTAAGEDPDDFFKRPFYHLRRITDDVVKTHMLAYSDAQRRVESERNFAALQRSKQQEIDQLRPFIDEVYLEDKDVFDSLPKDRSLNLLLKRAREREGALRAQIYHQEMRQLLEGAEPAAPTGAVAPTAGALPSAGGGRRPEPAPNGDWSRTPAFDRLWRSRSDSNEEMRAIVDILGERGFGNDIPIQ